MKTSSNYGYCVLKLQTYRSSYQSGVRKETISKYMDTCGIHTYTINSYPIVYINQRRESDNHRCRNNVSRKCQVCEWELDAASSALFCSIECKVHYCGYDFLLFFFTILST